MKVLTTVLAGLGLAGTAVHAHPLDLPFELTDEHRDFLKRSAEGTVPGGYPVTTGVQATFPYPRLEIRSLVHNQPNQFSLFILAMQKFQARPQSSVTSYYQIAGIHGVPRQSWGNVNECSQCINVDGYCTHQSVLFPAWHRAYMALFEQELYSIVANIANSWPTKGVRGGPNRAAMKKAAHSFRMPYWDWAAIPPSGSNSIPGSISGNRVNIQTPNGPQTVVNPLFKHHFENESNLHYPIYNTWPNTLRYPTNDSQNAISQPPQLVAAFNNVQGSLQDSIYQLMTTCNDYLHFSNIAGGSSSTSCSNSLEGIHDIVHSTAGGPGTPQVPQGGHMTYLSLAAFDPVFWIHHANVDRLFAMWQRLHPGSYGASQVQVSSTWFYPNGSTQNANSPLKPFYKNPGAFWTTNDVRNWEQTFHYTYPEFTNGKGSKQDIASVVNRLYGPNATPTVNQEGTEVQQNFAATTTTAAPTSSSGLPNPFTAVNGSSFQYVANIKAPRNALSGPYSIYLFNGQPAESEPTRWLFDSNLIGLMSALSTTNMENMPVMISGSVPLTRTLTNAVKNGTLPSLSELNVGPYLAKNLVWKIAGPSGEDVDPSKLPGFEVSVYASTASAVTSIFDLPTWSDFVPLPQVTKGKAGGLEGMLSSVGDALEGAASSIENQASSIL